MRNYRNISSLKELREAGRQLSFEIRIKEREIADDYESLKSYLNPAAYVHRLLERFYAVRRLIGFFEKAYESLRGFFNRKRNGSGNAGGKDGQDNHVPSDDNENAENPAENPLRQDAPVGGRENAPSDNARVGDVRGGA